MPAVNVNLYLQAQDLDAIDEIAHELNPLKPSRSEAVRALIALWNKTPRKPAKKIREKSDQPS